MTSVQGISIDVTSVFKSSVSAIKSRNKQLGIANNLTNIFRKHEEVFFIKANEIFKNISSHYKLLTEHKRNYLKEENKDFTECDKIYLEKVIHKNLSVINDSIKALELELKIKKSNITSQAVECRKTAFSIIKKNYYVISSLFKSMKEIRLKKQKEKDKLLSLYRPTNGRKNIAVSNFPEERKNVNEIDDTSEGSFTNTKTYSSVMEREAENFLSELSVEESQMLEMENSHLHKELLSNRDELRQITHQVESLSRIQDEFTEHVDIQGQQIDDIHDTVIYSTDNVQRGNEEVREAMRKDAAFRVWIMFILIVMSFSILFLDWYNP